MKKVVIYTSDYCPYCIKAKKLLHLKNIPFHDIDITDDEDDMLAKLEEKTGWETVPQIFIDDKFIGGFDSLLDLDKNQKLDELLKD